MEGGTLQLKALRTLFASYGLSEEVVSDNGPQFTSSVFKSFLKNNGVKQTLSPPYHPASNRAAERSVQILKRSLERQVLHSKGLLSTDRNTPHTVTGETPTSLFLKQAPVLDCHCYIPIWLNQLRNNSKTRRNTMIQLIKSSGSLNLMMLCKLKNFKEGKLNGIKVLTITIARVSN